MRRTRLILGALAAGIPFALSAAALADNPHGTPPGQAKQDQAQAAPAPKPDHAAKPEHAKKPKHAARAPKAAKTPKTTAPKTHGPAGKTTICHSTGSATNPYVTITISNNALPAHARHHDGRDIIPAPAGGCPQPAPAPAAGTPSGGNGHSGGNGNAHGHTKVTICHATGSATNPYVKITIAEPAVRAHARHQDGRDIIPAPADGCPAPAATTTKATPGTTGSPSTPAGTTGSTTTPTTTGTTRTTDAGAVLGESVSGAPASGDVLAETESGSPASTTAGNDNAAAAVRRETGANTAAATGRLPFTGLDLILVIAAGLGALLAGLALRRVLTTSRTTA